MTTGTKRSRNDSSGRMTLSIQTGRARTAAPWVAGSWVGSVWGSRSPDILPQRSSVPELLGGEARAFRHRPQLGEDHVGIDRGLPNPGAVAAIGAGDDILAADQLGVAADALRDQFRVLDEIRF